MSENIKIALLGLGEIGQDFAEHFLEITQEGGKPVEIVAVSHDDMESPIVMGFQQNGVPVYQNAIDVIEMGDKVDIIFDLTGDSDTRQGLRRGMQDSKNNHTVIAPEIMAQLLWMFFDTDTDMSQAKGSGY